MEEEKRKPVWNQGPGCGSWVALGKGRSRGRRGMGQGEGLGSGDGNGDGCGFRGRGRVRSRWDQRGCRFLDRWVGACRAPGADGLAGDLPVATQEGRPQAQESLKSDACPPHPGSFAPIPHDLPVCALDRPTGDGEAPFLEVWIAAAKRTPSRCLAAAPPR